jgi:hypothetical protein
MITFAFSNLMIVSPPVWAALIGISSTTSPFMRIFSGVPIP